jgi:hypothetical protein
VRSRRWFEQFSLRFEGNADVREEGVVLEES